MDDDPIPTLLRPEDTPPLRTQAELHRYWRALMGELGFSGRRLWVQFLRPDERPAPVVMPIDELPELPDPEEVGSLMTLCVQVRAEHGLGRVAMLLSRPGGAQVRPGDLAWGRALVAAAARTGLPLAPVHLANDEMVVPLAVDDLLAAG